MILVSQYLIYENLGIWACACAVLTKTNSYSTVLAFSQNKISAFFSESWDSGLGLGLWNLDSGLPICSFIHQLFKMRE